MVSICETNNHRQIDSEENIKRKKKKEEQVEDTNQ